MLKNYIEDFIHKNLQHTPTSGQQLLIRQLSDFVSNPKREQLFLLKGYAGTGKTTIISALVKALEHFGSKTVLLAPTGRAAKVLSSYSEKPAYTIHKEVYRQKGSDDGFGKFLLAPNLRSDTLFLIDEASMISNHTNEISIFGSGRLLDDLYEYVYSGTRCKMILIGDTAQLPPVGLDKSPALTKKILENYDCEVIEVVLTEVVRQSLDSGILFNATEIRNLIPAETPENEQEPYIFSYPKIKLEGFKDIRKLNGAELIEEISTCYDKFGMEETMVVSRSNKRANRYNQGIRNQILYREEEISVGDLLMVVKNNYFWLEKMEEMEFIANGDIVEITRIHSYKERYEHRYADVTIRFLDYQNVEIEAKIMLDTLQIETASLSSDENKKLYYSVAEDYAHIGNKKKRLKQIREDPFFNALQVKFAYAVTCHKAQGGQWKAIFVDQGYLAEDMLNKEYLRWLYTAITRSSERLYLVNFKDEYFL